MRIRNPLHWPVADAAILCHRSKRSVRMIDLFCLPFAGGNKYAFREFEKLSPPYLNFIPIEYPGRGSRSNEPLLGDIGYLADDVFVQIERAIGSRPYSIYGHSMGALLAYLVARKLLA